MVDLSKLNPSKVQITSTYREATPEERERHAQIRAEVEAHLPEMRAEAKEAIEKAMKTGLRPRAAIAALTRDRQRRGLSFEEMNARSGIDCGRAAELEERDSDPTLKTLEAYAEALGKKLLIVLADEGDHDGP